MGLLPCPLQMSSAWIILEPRHEDVWSQRTAGTAPVETISQIHAKE